MRIVAIDTPDNPQHLDHLIPLCDLLNAKLLIRDIENKKIVEQFYPIIATEYIFSLDQIRHEIGIQYDYLIHSFFWPEELFKEYFADHKIKSIFTPHGNSDKHAKANWMTRFEKQDFCLIYGQHMMDFLKEERVSLNQYAYIGNLRFNYYQKHKNYFYENYSKKIINKLDKNKKTVLYAPTKKDEGNFLSFNIANIAFFEALAEEFNLIIKLHPHYIENFPEEALPFLGRISSKALTIENSPLVYPLLDICDAMITDYSSIGYDFLTFDRPLFFIQTERKDNRSTYLHSCGLVLDQNSLKIVDSIKQVFNNDPFSQKRKELYKYTFHSNPNLLKLLSPSSRGGSTKTD